MICKQDKYLKWSIGNNTLSILTLQIDYYIFKSVFSTREPINTNVPCKYLTNHILSYHNFQQPPLQCMFLHNFNLNL
jgi:hypothetical protein